MRLATILIAASAGLLCAPQLAAADGKEVYDKSCAACHSKGIGGALKLTDKDKWAPIVKQGSAAVTATVIKGKGIMPPKGGAASDADVKAAVDYLISQVK